MKIRVPIVFPTCVGMNRFIPHYMHICNRVPHMRGDEPEFY